MTLNDYIKGITVVIKCKNGYTQLAKMTESGLVRPGDSPCRFGDMDISKFKMGTTEFVNGASLLMFEYDGD